MFRVFMAISFLLQSVAYSANGTAVLNVTPKQFQALQFVYSQLERPGSKTYQQWVHALEPLTSSENFKKIDKVFKKQKFKDLPPMDVEPKADSILVKQGVGSNQKVLVIFRGNPSVFGEYNGAKITWEEALDMNLFYKKMKSIESKKNVGLSEKMNSGNAVYQCLWRLLVPEVAAYDDDADGFLWGMLMIGGGLALGAYFIAKGIRGAGREARLGMREGTQNIKDAAERLGTSLDNIQAKGVSINGSADLNVNANLGIPSNINITGISNDLTDQINQLLNQIRNFNLNSTQTFGISPSGTGTVR